MSDSMPGGVVVHSVEIGPRPTEPRELVSWIMKVANETCRELDELLKGQPPATLAFTGSFGSCLDATNSTMNIGTTGDAIIAQYCLNEWVCRLQEQVRTGLSEHRQPPIVTATHLMLNFRTLCRCLISHDFTIPMLYKARNFARDILVAARDLNTALHTPSALIDA